MNENGRGNAETNVRIAFEGVEVAVEIGPRTMVSPMATLVDQTKVRAAVKGCRECDARGQVDAPTPAKLPLLNHRYAVIVPREMEPAERKTLVTAMRNAGLGDRPLEAVATIPRVGCSGGMGTRPGKDALAACHGHVADQLWAANTNYVLLIGGTGKDLWRPDLTMQQVQGRVGVLWDRYVTMVLPSPEAILALPGGRKKEETIGVLMRGLRLWKEVLDARIAVDADEPDDPHLRPVTGDMARDCVLCGRVAQEMDRDGLGWCRKDWTEGRRAWRVARGVIGRDGTEAMF